VAKSRNNVLVVATNVGNGWKLKKGEDIKGKEEGRIPLNMGKSICKYLGYVVIFTKMVVKTTRGARKG